MTTWVAVDWGTSRLRIWGMDSSDGVLWQAESAAGMTHLTPDTFAPTLEALIAENAPGWTGPVVACGMVGSRQGWVEAPYRSVPCTPLGSALTHPKDHAHVGVVGGLSQTAPADVMRGEETQIAGFLSLNPEFDGVICLPGTHTKWAHISAGEVVSFQTFMTGEMFALLSQHSVLRHGLAPPDTPDPEPFDKAVADTLSRPEKLAAGLFSLRAEGLLNDLPPAQATARLSGLLVGAELAAAKPYWLGRDIALIGADTLARAYARALAQQGVPTTLAKADTMTLKGLAAARRRTA